MRGGPRRFGPLLGALAALAIAGGAALPASGVAASAAAPGWEAGSHSYPTNLPPGDKGTVAVDVYDIGAAASTAPATVSDTLPEGLTGISSEGWLCTGSTPMTCTYELESLGSGNSQEIPLEVEVSAGASEGTFPNVVSVFGGGAPATVSDTSQLSISSSAAGFGFAAADAWFANADGTLDTQAGSHPYTFTFGFSLNADAETEPAGAAVRNLTVELPPGLIGNQRALPRCTRLQFDSEECPPSTQIGLAPIGITLGGRTLFTLPFPLYNLAPPPGSPAEFGFDLLGIHAFFDASVRSASDYGITVRAGNLPQRSVLAGSVSIWGVPADPRHDPQRCGFEGGSFECGLKAGTAQVPFMTLPSTCAGPESFSADVGSWRSGTPTGSISFTTHDASGAPSGLSGCERLGFAPSLTLAPDTGSADTPAGLASELRVPQEGLLDPEGLATSNISDATLTLPEGLAINPGEAAGLAACEPSEDGVGSENPPSCPPASTIGAIEAQSPILLDTLKGNAYLLASNPPNLQLLLAASGDGVEVKVIAHVHLDETTGRLSTTLSNLPPAPISDFKLSFSGGAQAALVTPAACGMYSTGTDFTPWSAPLVLDAFPSSSFAIESGSGGGACPPTPLPFTPAMSAGSTSAQAGGYTNFSLELTRPDDQQQISSFQFKLPPGLLGMVSKVTVCGEPEASQGDCPASSRIGHAESQAGPGPYPLLVPEPGRPLAPMYLTGPYGGAPYGISVAVPVIVGPFDLGTVVVRGSVNVDPSTAALTISTDRFPTILDGVPPELRTIVGVVDRPGFMFNPTSCNATSITGSALSTEGTTAPMQNRFQVGSCASLPFKPELSISTSGHASRSQGASLDVKLTYPPSPPGSGLASSQANVAKVKVSLPKQLPARLTTIQQACPAHIFDADPAGCPAPSRIGAAHAATPVLPGELTGPAYFVSNGGAKFPELIVILTTSNGVSVELHGETFISKDGITSATFASIPDVPISSFELDMPQGPYSALAANGNLCTGALKMPTEFVAQNGAVIVQSTPVAVSGCPKAKGQGKAHRGRRKGHARKPAPYTSAFRVPCEGEPPNSRLGCNRQTTPFSEDHRGRHGSKNRAHPRSPHRLGFAGDGGRSHSL